MKFTKTILIGASMLVCSSAKAYCFDEAGRKYQIDPNLVKAISIVESKGKADAFHINNDNTWDYGLMQINSSHLNELKALGIGKDDLGNPCQVVHVGAWILARNIKAYGNTWNAVGAYNVGCKKLSKSECAKRRLVYVNKVKPVYEKLVATNEY